MSNPIRIIPRLDIKGPNLVKGIHLEGLRVLGKPEEFSRFYYENDADELFYQDVVASLYNRNSLSNIIRKTAGEIFIPLTVGGGIKTIGDIASLLQAGADKVSINTAAIEDPSLIETAARFYGSSTIVVSIEAIRQPNGTYQAFTDNGRNRTEREVVEWARTAEAIGAGEIVITSVDRDGGGNGFDVPLVNSVCNAVSIPVIAHGGAGKPEHVLELVKNCDVSGVAIASLFHYEFITGNKRLHGYESEGNIDYLKSGQTLRRVTPVTIRELKSYLRDQGVECRL
jgi:cyclase